MRRSDLVQHKEKEKGATTRTSQIVFGERQHLLRVLDSLEGTEFAAGARAAGAPLAGRVDSRAHPRTESDQYRVG